MPDPSPRVPHALQGKSILVVDDDELVRKVATAMLSRLGACPHAVANGHEAIARIADGPDPIDAVLLDLAMPGFDGVATLKEIRRLRPDLPVLICSGGAPADRSRLTTDLGVPIVLDKPFALAALEKALESVLR